MKRLILLSISAVLMAQLEQFSLTAPYLLNPAFSAPLAGDTLWANIDIPPDTLKDTLGNIVGYDSIVSVYLFYSSDNQNTWNSLALSLLGSTFYENTWEGNLIYPGSGSAYFYFIAVDDSGPNFSMESPKNINDLFPPPTNLLASAAMESGNDMDPGSPGDWLEITDFKISFSDQKLYFRMANATGDYPWDEGGWFPLEFYVYAFGIINPPEFKRDSDTVYIAVRADIGLMGITPGLYKVYENANGETQFVQIGNISEAVSGGYLYVSCNFSDLINDPNFGVYTGELAVAAITAWADLNGLHFADATQPARWYPRIHILTPGANTSPYLVNPGVNPPNGDTTTIFTFTVSYVDNENNLPPVRNLYIDNSPIPLGTPDHYYKDSSFFSINLGPFNPGWHEFYFKFSDGEYVINSPLDSFFVWGVGIAEIQLKDKKVEFIPTIIHPGLSIRISPEATLNLYNAQGRKILSVSGKDKLVFPEAKSGIYFIELKKKGKNKIKKVLIF